MGWFDRVTRRFVQGAETIGDNFLIEPMPDVSATGPVTLVQARGLPGVGRGARLIADVASQLPVNALRNVDSDALTEKVFPTPKILKDPDPTGSPGPGWFWAVVDSLVWHGNALAHLKDPKWAGRTLRPYPTTLPLWDVAECVYNQDDSVWEVPNRQPVSVADVLHMRVHAPAGARTGLGLLDTYQTELRVMAAAEAAQYVLLEHGVPTGLLKVASGTVVTPDQAKTIKEAWLTSQTRRSVAVMSNIDFQKVSFTADELSMIPTREFNLRLASDITGVPPYMLGVPSESRVYANAETEWQNFIRTTLAGYLAPVEYALSTCLPSEDLTARFDMSPLYRGDAKSRWEVYQIGHGLGAITVEEIRNAEGLGPIPPGPPALEVVPDVATG